MDKDKIRQFYLKSAQAKHAIGFDALKIDADELRALEREYLQHLAEVNPKSFEAKADEEQVPWKEVMMFLRSLFMQMNSNAAEPDHEEAMAFREMAFSVIGKAMLATYAKPDAIVEPKPGSNGDGGNVE